ncbi:MAG: sigma-70 family RNA polymerase sigma factor [Actinomycetota bacterium]|nr:sigma-70 family RNA polymerase sigma factor [Actinomycetota bacterium]
MGTRAAAAEKRVGRERDLLAGCRAGDPRAWEQVLADYERLVYSIPLRYGLSRDDAADITQVVFTTLLQSLDSIRDEERLGPWLATVARRQSWRVMERGKLDAPSDDLPEPVVADPMEERDRLEWLYDGLLALDERCRELLVVLYLQEQCMSYAEASRRLGRPIGSIGPTRARCLERLRRVLEE